jgi:hypothetical protein
MIVSSLTVTLPTSSLLIYAFTSPTIFVSSVPSGAVIVNQSILAVVLGLTVTVAKSHLLPVSRVPALSLTDPVATL